MTKNYCCKVNRFWIIKSLFTMKSFYTMSPVSFGCTEYTEMDLMMLNCSFFTMSLEMTKNVFYLKTWHGLLAIYEPGKSNDARVTTLCALKLVLLSQKLAKSGACVSH